MCYAYLDKNDFTAAEAAYKNYIRLLPTEANPYDSMGDFYTKTGKQKEAIVHFKKAAELDPNFNISLTKVGDNYVLLGKYDEARKAYQLAESKATTPAEKAHNMLAIATSYLAEGRYKECQLAADKAKKLLRDSNSEVYTQMNDFPGAGKELQAYKAIESKNLFTPMQLTNTQQRALFVKALMAVKAKKLDEATAKAEEIKTKAGANPVQLKDYHKLAGLIAFEKGDMAGAGTHLQQADQQNPRVLYLQSMVAAKAGDTQKSDELRKKLNSLNEVGFEHALVKAAMQKKPRVAAK